MRADVPMSLPTSSISIIERLLSPMDHHALSLPNLSSSCLTGVLAVPFLPSSISREIASKSARQIFDYITRRFFFFFVALLWIRSMEKITRLPVHLELWNLLCRSYLIQRCCNNRICIKRNSPWPILRPEFK